MNTSLMAGVRVLTLGERFAVRICGKALAQAGATVAPLSAQAAGIAPPSGEARQRAAMASTDGAEALQQALAAVDIVILASDTLPSAVHDAVRGAARATGRVIVCDVTGAGPVGPYAHAAHTDAEIQALTGLLDTTGFPGAAPALIGLPYCEVSAGLYAASAATAALLAWRRDGLRQDVHVSLYASATNALTTFLPHVFAGKEPSRIGNRHSSAAPWNAYATADGWILICTSTQEQWQRLAALIGEAGDPALATPRERVANAAQLDRLISAWTQQLSTARCLALCSEADIPAGPVLTIDQLAKEPNVLHRAMLAGQAGAASVGTPYRIHTGRTAQAAAAAATAAALAAGRLHAAPPGISPTGPLSGIRVIEIGQYTTAPLVGKHLAALGAEVIKIEPPGGDPTRDWPHGQDDTSYFFALSNADKTSRIVDLKTSAGRAILRDLLSSADVFVENLRPGAMAKLGFGPGQLHELNPRLVYCAISGFGADSAYPGRPAFDTVIQAMSGFMDLTRANGTPAKAGISAADILSGQMALFCVNAALLKRAVSGSGAFIDLAMQDVAVWATALAQTETPGAPSSIAPCSDGHLLLSGGHAALVPDLQTMTRAEALGLCRRTGIRAVPVLTVAETVRDAHFRSHALGLGRDASGRFWPVLSLPYHYSHSPLAAGRVLAGAPA